MSIQENKTIQKNPEMWASIARICACGMIFVYHYSGLYGKSLRPLDVFAIIIFVFLSGYFSFRYNTKNKKRLAVWLVRRIKSIMIPYWQIIVLVIIINDIIQYKETSFLKNLIILLGGSMFVNNPLYVISWFITLILLLYFFIFLFQVQSNTTYKVITFFVGFTCALYLNMVSYFIAFCIGYMFKPIKEKYVQSSQNIKTHVANEILYKIQNYCYSFFLVHGGILLLVIKIMNVSPINSFIISFILTAFITLFHYNFSLILQKRIVFPFEKNIEF